MMTAQTDIPHLVLSLVRPLAETPREVERATLLADLGLDDLDRDVIAMDLGDALGFHIGDDEARRWQSVQDIIDSAEKADA